MEGLECAWKAFRQGKPGE